MANPGWTDEQKSVIDARGREILVSAAAGSGKTAVLVERVYKEVMEGIDLDRFVVVTFTKAAAAEMKERLRKRFEEALEDTKLPDVHRQRIRRQLRLIPSAHISTVHSFCNYIIGQYFHRIGIDPSYSLASDSELKLIKKEVVSELLERQYELLEENESMMEKISASSAFTKSDAALEDLIISVYEKSVSEPFPDIVFSDWETMLNAPLDSEDSPYIRELLKRTADTMSGVYDCSDDLLNKYYLLQDKDKKTFVGLKNISIKITDIFEDYNNKNITAAGCFEEMRKAFIQMDLSGFPKSKPSKDELRIKAFMELKPVRELVEKTYSDYFSKTLSEHDEDRAAMAETTLELIGLAREFGERFDAAKRDRGLVDYNDLEQFALRILFDKDSNGRPVRSDAARELSGYFHEIMIDEYQDSNRVQDTILWAIAKPDGTYDESADLMPWEAVAGNRFMVGDIKQSIYRFRNACPELFEHKMNTYRQLDRSTETVSDEGAELTDRDSAGSGQIRIDLHRNFRSGRIIIDSTNEVFKRIMHSDIGGVEYDRDAELVMGLDAETVPDNINAATKVCIENLYHDRENTDTVTGKSMSNDEAGAYYIANRIKEMVEGDDPLMIRTGRDSFRPVRYRDIVILSRSVSPISYIYSDVFAAVGVPFVTELKQGFYGSREVSLIIQMLSVINNPLQDIPLAAVLLSPMVNVTEEELGRVIAVLKQNDIKRSCLYNMIEEYTSGKNTEFSDPGIREKLASFLSFIKEKRQKTYYTSLSETVEDIYYGSCGSIYSYFLSLSDGARRTANLDYLLLLVDEFEQKGHHGIDEFIRYISQITENGLDEGEAVTIGEEEDVVRLMSVHKSKGLEFPVVIIARGESEGRNQTKNDSRVVFDEELGIGAFVENYNYQGLFYKPLIWRLINEKNNIAERGELFRLLYVAMTRAKDQLIVVNRVAGDTNTASFTDRRRMRSFMSMLEPAVAADDRHELFSSTDHTIDEFGSGTDEDITSGSETGAALSSDRSRNNDLEKNKSDRLISLLETVFATGHDDEAFIPAKISVSELKKSSLEENENVFMQDGEPADQKPDGNAVLNKPFIKIKEQDNYPKFMREDMPVTYTGAERGTIYHHVMAVIDLKQASFDISDAFDTLINEGYISKEKIEIVDIRKIKKFISSELCVRMISAADASKLHREQPFIFNKPAHEIRGYEDSTSDDNIMIQGIIDAYFEEDGELVLMDYKTDSVSDPDELADKYRIQMDLYSEALEKATGMRVKERYIYSFHQGTTIPVDRKAMWC